MFCKHCDGASSNLTMIKEMSGDASKAYGYEEYIKLNKYYKIIHHSRFNDEKGKDSVEVEPFFLNPYTDRKVYFVICPSHQVMQCQYIELAVSLICPTAAEEHGFSTLPVSSKDIWRN